MSTRADGSTTRDTRTAVYQAALQLRSPNHPWRVAVGRQYLAPVSSLSLFDGLLLEAQGSRLGVGVFGGSEPDQGSMGYSADIRDYGAFLELRNAPGGSTRWNVATGGVGSYQAGEVNREFVFAQASLSTPGLTIFAAQEADLNRGWKQDAGEPAFAMTSSFVSVNARPTPALALNAGLDTRRRVRLYRDRANPEQSFDDSFRQGIWSGASVRAGAHLRFGLDGRAALGGPDSTAHSHSTTGSLAVERLTTQQLSVRSRYTRYGTSRGSGWLGTLSAGVRPGQALGIEFNGGRRSEVATLDQARRQTTWVGADLDVAVGSGDVPAAVRFARAWRWCGGRPVAGECQRTVLIGGAAGQMVGRQRGSGAAGPKVDDPVGAGPARPGVLTTNQIGSTPSPRSHIRRGACPDRAGAAALPAQQHLDHPRRCPRSSTPHSTSSN